MYFTRFQYRYIGVKYYDIFNYQKVFKFKTLITMPLTNEDLKRIEIYFDRRFDEIEDTLRLMQKDIDNIDIKIDRIETKLLEIGVNTVIKEKEMIKRYDILERKIV